MKAVVLAGGWGTRLRPLTLRRPKEMVPVLNRPLLEHLLVGLGRAGVAEVILTLGHHAEVVRDYFGDGSAWRVRLTYAIEEAPLGTAGAVKNVESSLDDTFLVLNGDIFSDLDFEALVAFHRKAGARATIAAAAVEDNSTFGVIDADAAGRVYRFIEKPPRGSVDIPWVNQGTYVLEPETLASAPVDQFFQFEQGLFPRLLQEGVPVYTYRADFYWRDLGTPARYLELHRELLGDKVSAASNEEGEGVETGPGCTIDPTATVIGPVVIGEGARIEARATIVGPTAIGAGCQIGEGCTVREAVLWDDVHLARGAAVEGCVLASGTRVGEGAFIETGCVLGEGVVVEGGTRLPSGALLWPDSRLGGNVLSEGPVFPLSPHPPYNPAVVTCVGRLT